MAESSPCQPSHSCGQKPWPKPPESSMTPDSLQIAWPSLASKQLIRKDSRASWLAGMPVSPTPPTYSTWFARVIRSYHHTTAALPLPSKSVKRYMVARDASRILWLSNSVHYILIRFTLNSWPEHAKVSDPSLPSPLAPTQRRPTMQSSLSGAIR